MKKMLTTAMILTSVLSQSVSANCNISRNKHYDRCRGSGVFKKTTNIRIMTTTLASKRQFVSVIYFSSQNEPAEQLIPTDGLENVVLAKPGAKVDYNVTTNGWCVGKSITGTEVKSYDFGGDIQPMRTESFAIKEGSDSLRVGFDTWDFYTGTIKSYVECQAE